MASENQIESNDLENPNNRRLSLNGDDPVKSLKNSDSGSPFGTEEDIIEDQEFSRRRVNKTQPLKLNKVSVPEEIAHNDPPASVVSVNSVVIPNDLAD